MIVVRGLLLLAGLCLAACTSVPSRAPPPVLSPVQLAAAEAGQSAREQALAARPRWTLAGRVAVSRGREAGSGRLDWRQDRDQFDVSLTAPVTRQGWRLVGGPDGARLEGMVGGPRSGADASLLLFEATGLEVPVVALVSWARGIRADAGYYGPAELTYAIDGRLLRLAQAGWVIDYLGWSAVDGSALPQRLDATRGDARVRLIVDSWSGSPGP